MTDQPNTSQSDPQPNKSEAKTPFAAFLEHQTNAAQETLQAFQALVPPDFRKHSAVARHEFLLSFKALVDGATEAIENEIKRMHDNDSNDKPGTGGDAGSDRPSTTGKSKVKVEVL